jgi:hypothetical protein
MRLAPPSVTVLIVEEERPETFRAMYALEVEELRLYREVLR